MVRDSVFEFQTLQQNPKSELIRCYETEIAYQKHMLENLGRWMTLFLAVTSLGFLLIYFFNKHIILLILGFVLMISGSIEMLLFGYGIYHGKKNVAKVIDDFETKLNLLKNYSKIAIQKNYNTYSNTQHEKVSSR